MFDARRTLATFLETALTQKTKRNLYDIGCAACWAIWGLLVDRRSKRTLLDTELFLDQMLTNEQIVDSWRSSNEARLEVASKREVCLKAMMDIARAISVDTVERAPAHIQVTPELESGLICTLLDGYYEGGIDRLIFLMDNALHVGISVDRARVRSIVESHSSAEPNDMLSLMHTAKIASSQFAAAAAISRLAWAVHTGEYPVLQIRSVVRYAEEAIRLADLNVDIVSWIKERLV